MPKPLFRFRKSDLGTYPLAMLEFDPDPKAERYMVIDRLSSVVMYSGPTDLVKRYFDPSYATEDRVLLVMLDDTKEYNAVCADGVTLQLIDGIAEGL